MKRKLIFPVMLLCLQTFAQQPSLDKFSFLLGSLNDYIGRYRDSSKNVVDRYFYADRPVMYHNYKLLKEDYPDLKIDSIKYRLLSHTLSIKVEQHFKYKREDTEPYDPTYGGTLFTSGLLDTKSQQLSYLAGAFIRFGSIQDENNYTISVANSINVFPNCIVLLKELECNITKSEIFKENIPVGYVIHFEPTEEVKAFLLQYGVLKR